MLCLGCGNDKAYCTNTVLYEKGRSIEVCDRCGNAEFCVVPDVYVDGKPDENLPDDPRTGNAPIFSSKLEKALYLRQHHLVEYRGREHGGPAIPREVPSYSREQGRHEALKALHRVKQMGRDVRRQEYLKIVKEGEKRASR